jgi:hypothetical protein
MTNAPEAPPQKTQVPAHLWPRFDELRYRCREFHSNFASTVRWCLGKGEYRALGEWLADVLTPAGWAAGLTHGFECGAPEKPRKE